MKRISYYGLVLTILIPFLSCREQAEVWPFEPAPGSSIVVIGNSFAEGLQRSNYFETLLHRSFPDHHLRVRNLGWSADEVNLRPRALNFGTLEEHLHRQEIGRASCRERVCQSVSISVGAVPLK